MHSHTCLSLTLVVIGLVGSCSIFLLVCITIDIAALSFPFIYACLQSAERAQSRRFAFLYMRIIILVLLVVVGLFGRCIC